MVIAAAVVVTFFLAFAIGFTVGYVVCLEDSGFLERASEVSVPGGRRPKGVKLVSLETGLGCHLSAPFGQVPGQTGPWGIVENRPFKPGGKRYSSEARHA